MGFTIELVSSGIHEGDLAIKVFEAARIIRENYGIDVIIEYINDGIMGCTGFCGPPKIVAGKRSIVLSESVEYELKELAQMIVKLIFGELGDPSTTIASVKVEGPEARVGALAS
ncbi:MAG: hypothetical protein F7B17_00715 [Desulfurococcales archaeon]|nr:hypothetical protein [Desulfurococcales archaeon]